MSCSEEKAVTIVDENVAQSWMVSADIVADAADEGDVDSTHTDDDLREPVCLRVAYFSRLIIYLYL